MNRFLTVLILTCIFSAGSFYMPPPAPAAESINWYSYADGIERARDMKKKIYINFHADWCGYCHKMERETFTDSGVVDYLNKNYISIRVNSDKEKNLARQFHVRGLPDNVFIDEAGQNIGNQPGFLGPKDFLKVIHYVYEEKYKSHNK